MSVKGVCDATRNSFGIGVVIDHVCVVRVYKLAKHITARWHSTNARAITANSVILHVVVVAKKVWHNFSLYLPLLRG